MAKYVPLPPELARFESYPDLAYVTDGEWSAGHPGCPGGASNSKHSDRLRIFAATARSNAHVWCRRCDYHEWADADDVPEYVKNRREQRPERDAERERLRQERMAAEAARMSEKIKQLQEEAYWRGWHDAMQERERMIWRKAGIPDSLQDRFVLGYTPDKAYSFSGELHHTPALTIPVFEVGWSVANVQYRLLDAPARHGKYRFTSGLESPLYLTDPDRAPHGRCLLAEGTKKALTLYLQLVLQDKRFDYVVAVPSVTPSLSLLDQLSECDQVVVVMDPDAYVPAANGAPPIRRMAQHLKGMGKDSLYVELPVKPDDFFTEFYGTTNQFMAYVDQGTRVRA
jgi:hypothetical protein